MIRISEKKATHIAHFIPNITLKTVRTLTELGDILKERHIGVWCQKCLMFIPFIDLDPMSAMEVGNIPERALHNDGKGEGLEDAILREVNRK